MMHSLSKHAEQLIRKAKEIARGYGLGYVGTEHLLLAIVGDTGGFGAEVLRENGANEYAVQAKVDELIKSRAQETWVLGRMAGTPHFKDVLGKAGVHARGTGNWTIHSEHLLLGLLEESDSLACRALGELNVSTEDVHKSLLRTRVCGGTAK